MVYELIQMHWKHKYSKHWIKKAVDSVRQRRARAGEKAYLTTCSRAAFLRSLINHFPRWNDFKMDRAESFLATTTNCLPSGYRQRRNRVTQRHTQTHTFTKIKITYFAY